MCYLLNSSVYLNGQNYLCIEVQSVLRVADCWSTGYKLYALLKKQNKPTNQICCSCAFPCDLCIGS